VIAWIGLALASWPEGGCEGMPCTPVAALAEAPIVLVGEVVGAQNEQGFVANRRHTTVVQVRVTEVLRGRLEGDVVEVWPGMVYGQDVVVVGELGVAEGRTLDDVVQPLTRGGVFARGTHGELLGHLDVYFPLQCLGPTGWAHIVWDVEDDGFTCPETHRLGFDAFLDQLREAAEEVGPSTVTVAAPRTTLAVGEDYRVLMDRGIRFAGYEPRVATKPVVLVDPLPAPLDPAPLWQTRPVEEPVPSYAVRRPWGSLDARFWRYATPGHHAATKAAREAAAAEGQEAAIGWADAREAMREERATWPYEDLMALRDAVTTYRRRAWTDGAYEVADWLLERQLDLESMTRDGPVDPKVLGVQACLLVDAGDRCDGCEEGRAVSSRARGYCR